MTITRLAAARANCL